ncbi:MAG: hypothetical protein IJG59_09485 [Erysipelotrichaceae bacterium]|nr:hypothetical protein [Erysipelotrichaceae bacterium]
MNSYIKMQLNTMIQYLDSFEQACQIAATRDDGQIDRKEEKQLRRIRKSVARFKRDLERISN